MPAKDVRVVIRDFTESGGSVYIDCSWRFNQAGTDYKLYANNDFRGIPKHGDPHGLIQQLVHRFGTYDSSCTEIGVTPNQIHLCMSRAADPRKTRDLILAAFRTAGFKVELITDWLTDPELREARRKI